MELAIKITLFCSLVLLVAVDTSKGDAVCDVTVTQQESQLCCLIHEVITDLDQLLLVCNSDNDVELNASEISESGSGINVTCGNSTSFMNDTMMEQLLSFMNCTESDPIDSNCSAVNFTCTTISTESGTSSIMPTSTSVATLNPTVSPTNGGSTVMSTRKAIGTATVTTPQPTMVQTESTTSGSETIEFQTTAMSDDLTIQTTTTSNQTANMSRVGSSDPIPLSLINILWIVLGCLIALIVITLCAVILACIANCRIRRHKSKH